MNPVGVKVVLNFTLGLLLSMVRLSCLRKAWAMDGLHMGEVILTFIKESMFLDICFAVNCHFLIHKFF